MPTLNEVIWETDLTPYIHINLLGEDITAVLSQDQQGIEGRHRDHVVRGNCAGRHRQNRERCDYLQNCVY